MLKILAIAAILCATSAAAEVTLINTFEIPKDQRDTVVAAWDKARNFLSRQTGYIDTTLYESLSPDSRFQLINVARWESPQSFQAAIEAMQKAKVFPQIEGVRANPALYVPLRAE